MDMDLNGGDQQPQQSPTGAGDQGMGDQSDLTADLLQRFCCMNTTDRDVLVEQMKRLLGQHMSDKSVFWLDTNNWKLQAVTRSCLDSEQSSTSMPLILTSDMTIDCSEEVPPNCRCNQRPRIGNSVIISFLLLICISPTHSTHSSVPSLCAATNLFTTKVSAITSIKLHWDQAVDCDSKIVGYSVRYTRDAELSERKWSKHTVNGRQTNAILTQLIPESVYYLKIKTIIDGNQIGSESELLTFKTSSPSTFAPVVSSVTTGHDESMLFVNWRASGLPRDQIFKYMILYSKVDLSGNRPEGKQWKVKVIEKSLDLDDIQATGVAGSTLHDVEPFVDYKVIIKVKTYNDKLSYSSDVFHYKYVTDYKTETLNIFDKFISLFKILVFPAIIVYIIYFLFTYEPKANDQDRFEHRFEQDRSYQSKNSDKPRHKSNAGKQRKRVPVFLNIGKDYYKVLGLERTAGDEEIKQAYRKLAKIYHPDKCLNDVDKFANAETMKDINEAYSILTDPVKRWDYFHNL